MLEAALAEAPHAEAAQVTRALKQMGLPREMHGTPARALSGGERARFCLAQVRVRVRVRLGLGLGLGLAAPSSHETGWLG